MKIQFVNHSCIFIEDQVLIDPWFSGKIFNDSWNLLQDTRIEDLQLDNLKYVVVSHEHPDHLHFPTLKKLIQIKPDLIFLTPQRKNDNVKKAVEKLGYEFRYLQPMVEMECNDFYITCSYSQGTDHTIVVKHNDEVVIHQNDHYINWQNAVELKAQYPNPDYWFFQFSLAGYYGNHTDPELIIQNGTKYHINKFREYLSFWNPKISVPFASFVYFCKEKNAYNNKYAVNLGDLITECNQVNGRHRSKQIDLAFYLDYIDDIVGKHDLNLQKWLEVFKYSTKEITPTKSVNPFDLLQSASLSVRSDGMNPPGPLTLALYDNDFLLELNYRDKEAKLVSKDTNKIKPCGITTTEELKHFFDTPWGADTLNVSACFEIYDRPQWNSLMGYKDSFYVR